MIDLQTEPTQMYGNWQIQKESKRHHTPSNKYMTLEHIGHLEPLKIYADHRPRNFVMGAKDYVMGLSVFPKVENPKLLPKRSSSKGVSFPPRCWKVLKNSSLIVAKCWSTALTRSG